MNKFTYEEYVQGLHPSEATSEFWLSQKIYLDKKAKYELAVEFKPKSIAEIGVRYGYSGWAFLSGADDDCEYFGFDLPTGNRRSGGVRGVDTLPWVNEHLTRYFGPRVFTNYINSQEEMILPGEPFDLVHVDGNHSYNGAFHDCVVGLMSLRHGGLLLVDDQDNGTVARATLGFISMFTGNIHDSFLRGTDYLIFKK